MGEGAAFTVMVTLELEVKPTAVAVNVSTYVPGVENVVVVDAAFALANVTVPGPLVLVQITVAALPVGTPVTEPDTVAEAGRVMV
jgi:hypothetical protein